MKTRWLAFAILCIVTTLALAACGNNGGNGGQGRNTSGNQNSSQNGGNSASTDGNPVAHMDNTVFVAPAATIQTGQSLTLTADTFVPHFISNGTWVNGTAKPSHEAGAPEVNELHINGNESAAIGPFTTAGTYQFYCTIHPNMNLAVTVE